LIITTGPDNRKEGDLIGYIDGTGGEAHSAGAAMD